MLFGSQSGRRADRVHGSSLDGQLRIQVAQLRHWKSIQGLATEVLAIPKTTRGRLSAEPAIDRRAGGDRRDGRLWSSGGTHAHVASEHQAELCVRPCD